MLVFGDGWKIWFWIFRILCTCLRTPACFDHLKSAGTKPPKFKSHAVIGQFLGRENGTDTKNGCKEAKKTQVVQVAQVVQVPQVTQVPQEAQVPQEVQVPELAQVSEVA